VAGRTLDAQSLENPLVHELRRTKSLQSLAGSVKWSRSVGRGELDRLRRAVEALPNRTSNVSLALFARDEVRDVDRGDARAFTAADLYR
jgi:hypothetical protein